MFKAESCSCSVFEVTLWKESVDGLWACISDVNKGQGGVSAVTEGQQNEQWCTTEYSSCSKWSLSLICYVSLAGWELILSKLDMNMENNYPILWALYYWEATNMLIISLNWHSLKFKQYSQVLCLILLLDTIGIIPCFFGLGVKFDWMCCGQSSRTWTEQGEAVKTMRCELLHSRGTNSLCPQRPNFFSSEGKRWWSSQVSW